MRIRARNTLTVVGMLVSALVLCALVAAPALASEGEGCPNEQLRQESNVNPGTEKPYSTELPECRAYEMVSPVLKAGDPVQAPINQVSPSINGGAVTYESYVGVFSEPEGFQISSPYLATRSTAGWVTRSAAVGASVLPFVEAGHATLFTPDLSQEVICGSPGEGSSTIIVGSFMCASREAGGVWQAATPAYPQVGTAGKELFAEIVGASRDLSHMVFNVAGAHLLPEDSLSTATTGLYEISRSESTDGTLRLVNVNNNGEQIGTAAPKLGNVLTARGSPAGRSLHAVSEDGSTVFFEATPTGGAQSVYARIGGASTVSISKPSNVSCTECQTVFSAQLPAEFQGASADGSKVFFTTEQELFAGKTGNNLYEYDFDAPTGQQVTLVSRGTANAAVQGVLTNSDDGSHIYFVAQGALTSTANAAGQHAAAGADNLYVFERDPAHLAGFVSFVATLCSGENLSGTVIDTQCPSSSTDKQLWTTEPEGQQNGRDGTTPDGRYLVFDTYGQLLAEDGNKALAVYRYDSQTGELTWISHGVPGFTVVNEGGSAFLPPSTDYGDLMGAQPDVSDRGRAIDEDGSDVVFTTTESLSPRDINKAPDTYIWHEGTVSLISDGVSPKPPTKAVAAPEDSSVITPSGDDIYFISTGRLVGQDVDELADMYDARIHGGFPAPKVVECASEEFGSERGEACQGTPAGVPPFSAPASSVFTGGANISSQTPASPSNPKPAVKSKKKVLTRAQKLTKALKICRKDKAGKKRVTCQKRARRQYGGKAKLTTVQPASKSGRGR